MDEYINREAVCKALNSEGYTKNMRVHKKVLDIPAADVVERSKYEDLLKAAKKMHEWIFLNSFDEEEAYRECGLTDEQNILLGSLGRVELNFNCGAEMDGGQDKAEIIYGIDMNTSTSNFTPTKRMCRQTGQICEFAGDYGYCKITACVRRRHGKGETEHG